MNSGIPWELIAIGTFFVLACRPIGRTTHRFQTFLKRNVDIGLPLTANAYSILFAGLGLAAILFALSTGVETR